MDGLCFIVHSNNKKRRHLTAISLEVKTTYVALVVRSASSLRVHKYIFEAKEKGQAAWVLTPSNYKIK